MFLKNLENFRKICIQSVFRAQNHDSFANFTNICCKAWIVLIFPIIWGSTTWIVLIFSRIWGSAMFLACSYFFRNLSLDVLISMVLIKKKGVLSAIDKIRYSQYIDLKRKCLGTEGNIHWSEVSVALGSAKTKFYCTSSWPNKWAIQTGSWSPLQIKHSNYTRIGTGISKVNQQSLFTKAFETWTWNLNFWSKTIKTSTHFFTIGENTITFCSVSS